MAPRKAELIPVPADHVAELWPIAEPLLAPELPNIDMTAEALRQACENDAAQLWAMLKRDRIIGAMVTILTPVDRCLVAICCGKRLWDYLPLRNDLYAWAKEQGMKEVRFYGRKALTRLMPECKPVGVILSKEL
jgi:hypothetical protein